MFPGSTPPVYLNEIENPNPLPGTNNWYTQDGYGGGSYTKCSDTNQPGVAAIVNYLNALEVPPNAIFAAARQADYALARSIGSACRKFCHARNPAAEFRMIVRPCCFSATISGLDCAILKYRSSFSKGAELWFYLTTSPFCVACAAAIL